MDYADYLVIFVVVGRLILSMSLICDTNELQFDKDKDKLIKSISYKLTVTKRELLKTSITPQHQ